jgi:hypothetical protein
MLLHTGATSFAFTAHPMFPHDPLAVFVLEGGESLIYQLRQEGSGKLYALKVFKPAFRGAHIAWLHDFLPQQPGFAGLALAGRSCFTKTNYPEVLRMFPDLEDAILMPWYNKLTWTGLMLHQKASAAYTRENAHDLALATATVLWDLEARGMAHTDVAGGNILLAPDFRQIRLIDIENMYVRGMPPPKKFSQGSPGYQHRHLEVRGQWCQEGDRFAGALLLTEMLTWWDPRVRAYVDDRAESLFRPEELQVIGTPCWKVVRDVLHTVSTNVLTLFDQAWMSSSLAECPTFSTWAMALLSAFA